jgi:hypothetical protein
MLSAPTTIVGNYVLQYEVNFTAFKSGWGTTNFGLGTQWLNAGSTYSISAFPYSGYAFQSWQVSTSLIAIGDQKQQVTSVTINGPGIITAKFTPSIELTLSDTSGSVNQVGYTTTVATITGASQSVTLSVFNANQLPSGISVSFAQNPITDSPSGVQDTITISSSSSVSPGTYSIVIQVVGSNGQVGQAIYTLTVT